MADSVKLAADIGKFLSALQRVDSADGPLPGAHNFYRGGSLQTYDAQTREAIAMLSSRLNAHQALKVWDTALSEPWMKPPVWVHGDVSVGNLLVQHGKLCAVIDSGNMAIGDPACDLVIAWAVFDEGAREAFRAEVSVDSATWARGKGWALWKALILAAGLTKSNAYEASRSWEIIHAVLDGRDGGAA